MSIIASQSVGSVIYAEISEPYPMFTASTKYVAITPNGRMFINIPNTGMWFPIEKSKNSEMKHMSQNQTTSFNATNSGIFSGFTTTQFTPTASTVLNGFTLQTATTYGLTQVGMSAKTNNIGRYINNALITTLMASTAAYDNMGIEITTALNGTATIPTISGGKIWGIGTDGPPDITNNWYTNINSNRILDIDGNNGDYVNVFRNGYSDGTTTWTPNVLNWVNYKLNNRLLEDATLIFYENWESGSQGSWNLANENQTNKWVIGTGTSYSGIYSAYISSGSTLTGDNSYNATATSVSHIWRTINLPVGNPTLTAKTPYYVSLKWKGLGNLQDYGKVYLTPTSITPSGGTEINTAYQLTNETGGTVMRNVNLYNSSKFLTPSYGTAFVSTAKTGSIVGYIENWESGNLNGAQIGFTGWTVANNATNKWVIGTVATSGTSNYSAYISNTYAPNGTYFYDVNTAAVSHIWTEITLPNTSSGISLSFDWQALGENGSLENYYDYGSVSLIPVTTTPAAGAEPYTTLATAGGNGRIGASTNLGKFNLVYNAATGWHNEVINITSWSGLTKRLLFSWTNDTSLGAQPPFAIDNIKITYTGTGISYTETSLHKINTNIGTDGYSQANLVFSWINDGTVANDPPIAIDNIAVYCYPAVT